MKIFTTLADWLFKLYMILQTYASREILKFAKDYKDETI